MGDLRKFEPGLSADISRPAAAGEGGGGQGQQRQRGRLGLPSNFHAAMSLGGVGPVKLKPLAPYAPAGMPRFDPLAESRSQSGPACVPVSTNLPGGSVSLAA